MQHNNNNVRRFNDKLIIGDKILKWKKINTYKKFKKKEHTLNYK